MSTSTALLASGYVGLAPLIFLVVFALFVCVVFAVILAYILKSFLHRGSETTTPESDGRSGRSDE